MMPLFRLALLVALFLSLTAWGDLVRDLSPEAVLPNGASVQNIGTGREPPTALVAFLFSRVRVSQFVASRRTQENAMSSSIPMAKCHPRFLTGRSALLRITKVKSPDRSLGLKLHARWWKAGGLARLGGRI